MSNETKWRDVAHLYAKSGILIKIKEVGVREMLGVQGTRGVVYLTGADAGHSRWSHHKPILRDIADLIPYFYDRDPSDEEYETSDRIWETLWSIVFPDSKEDKDADVFEETMDDRIWKLRRGSEILFLNEFGEMYATDVNGPKPFNAAAVVHFLTAEGFDIFGLIKSRQATRKPIPKP